MADKDSKLIFHEEFVNARYEVYVRGDCMFIEIERFNPWLDTILFDCKQKSCAFISAYNPLPLVLTTEENMKRHGELISYVEAQHYTYYEGKGYATDLSWFEKSILVLNVDLIQAIEIANKFDQVAIIFIALNEKAKIVYT